MGIIGFIFLSSGLFLGWSLGSQDASNVFGTAVATRMVKFKTAALVCSVFITLGAVISGVGAADTLGSLGEVNAIGGAFVTSFSAAFTASLMSKTGMTISVSQAVVGAIIGWNWYTRSVTDTGSLVKMASTWVACPLISGFLAVPLFAFFKKMSEKASLSLLQRDSLLRLGMIVTGAFGSYALGANNMANVVGVFIPVVPFDDFTVFGYQVTAVHQLFFVGSMAVAVGIYTYSYKVMMTVGKGVIPMSPFAAWVVVLCQGVVLFLFASEDLEYFLASHGLPTLPLVPVSSTQALVGAVLGIGLYKGGKNINWNVLFKIVAGWVIAPVMTACFCFFFLFFMENVFKQPVFINKTYVLSQSAFPKINKLGLPAAKLKGLCGIKYKTGTDFAAALKRKLPDISNRQELEILKYAELHKIQIDAAKIEKLPKNKFTQTELDDIAKLDGRKFKYRWELEQALTTVNPDWVFLPETVLNKRVNNKIKNQMQIMFTVFTDS